MTYDGRQLVYKNTDGNLHYVNNGGDKEKLDSDVTELNWFMEGESICYKKTDSLYIRVLGKDKEKIDSDVSYIYYADGKGVLYYVKSEELRIKLEDLVTFDTLKKEECSYNPEEECVFYVTGMYRYLNGEKLCLTDNSNSLYLGPDGVVLVNTWESPEKLKVKVSELPYAPYFDKWDVSSAIC